MNLRDLQYIAAVADHGHFGRAAAACHVSQPTLSGQILKLEAELGLKLFEREGRRARVVARAEPIIAHARAALAEAANVAAAARAARDPFGGRLRIGVIPTVAPYFLPLALPRALIDLNRTPLSFVEDLTDRLLAELADDNLDAIVIATDAADRRFHELALYDEGFFYVCARASQPPGRSIAVQDIDADSLLLLADGHCLRDQALDLCHAAARRSGAQADMRATSLETLRHLVAAGFGATLAPALAAAAWKDADDRLAALPVDGPGASRRVRLVFRRDSPIRAALEALAASLRASAPEALRTA